jgi:hypothetical protein
MSAGWLLLGLLAFAFIGSNVARGRGVRGFGLPSGSEWILVGIAFGPQLLGVVHLEQLSLFSPVLAAALGWVALTIGLRAAVCLRPSLRQEVLAPRRTLALGALVALVTAGVLAYVVSDLLGKLGSFSLRLRLGASLWIGCSLSGSARQIVDWAKERHGARGATTDGIEATIGGGEIVALCGAAPLSVLAFSGAIEPWDLIWRAVLPLVLGLLLGLIALALLHFEMRVAETWGILLGVQFLSVGLSLRASSSVVGAGFMLGWLLGRDDRSGAELRRMTHPAEGAVLLPLLVVAGASLHLKEVGHLGWLVAAVVGTRLVTKLLLGRLVCGMIVGQRLPATPLGLALASSGEIACLIALEYALSAPGQFGQLVLACAITASLFGELYGAAGLRRTLAMAKELGRTGDGASDRRAEISPESTGFP